MQMMLLWGKHFSAKSITIIKIRIQPIEAIGDRRAGTLKTLAMDP